MRHAKEYIQSCSHTITALKLKRNDFQKEIKVWLHSTMRLKTQPYYLTLPQNFSQETWSLSHQETAENHERKQNSETWTKEEVSFLL